MADDAQAVAGLGHNSPPIATPFEAIKVHMDDLLVEARNWADGKPVENDAQAGEIDRLIDDLRKAEKAADDARKEEVAPLDVQRDAIQDRYNEYIAPLKNKKPGRLSMALAALKATVEPWRKAKLAEAAAAAEAARLEAARAAEEAAAAVRNAAGDLTAREAAEDMVRAAEDAQRAAKVATKAATTGTGLTTFWRAEMTSQKAAILHYMNTDPEQFVALAQRLADADVYAGKRSIPGFNVIEDKRAR